MKKILLVSGDSFTDTNWISDYHDIGPNAWSMWPELLAKKLDMECINLAYSGAGNEYIYFSLLDEIARIDSNDIGLIVAGWSQCHRRDWNIKNKWHFSNYVNEINVFNNDMNAHIKKSLRYYYSLQEVCKSKKIPYKGVQIIHMFRGWSWDPNLNKQTEDEQSFKKKYLNFIHNSIYFNKIDENFIGFPGDKDLGGFSIKSDILGGYEKESLEWAVSKRDNHPNAKGQEKIAEFLYDRLG